MHRLINHFGYMQAPPIGCLRNLFATAIAVGNNECLTPGGTDCWEQDQLANLY
jgi:hypothetical protein